MQFLSLLTLATAAFAKNILLTNDDGWAATNIRAFYRDLKAAGHEVLMVAPVQQRSGWSGKFDLPYTKDLLEDGEFNYRNKGDPAWGYEEDDNHIWYLNGTPAGCVGFALDYVIPKYFPSLNDSIDLVVAGPNEGTNPGAFYTVSGTIGATYNAVYRGLPAIAFSGSNSNNSYFKDSLDEDPLNPSNILSKKSVDLVQAILDKQGDNSRALPLGTGLNVNFPQVGYLDESCTDPEYTFARVMGADTLTMKVIYNETTGLIHSGNVKSDALTVCLNGRCDLPSETDVVNGVTGACKASISVFSIDYDANAQLQNEAKTLFASVLKN